ncbi:hypothetical protein NX02_22620 [Sphingomonas sanxanigenens DSM 19645 = NX02]|uniref:Uncharacterized protein n=1 Tax=Sphingomonas sanxanigenens DSM 19645 = NX02 TaxID=1123269 RepID=W0AHX4_9SPHN|nr:hypothetical protein NX02_22620 [Sphingomonas sanxanigenens DSM 19645 = NX02]
MAVIAHIADVVLKLKGTGWSPLNIAAWCRLATVKQQNGTACNSIIPIIEWSDHIPIGAAGRQLLARKHGFHALRSSQVGARLNNRDMRKRLSHAVQ